MSNASANKGNQNTVSVTTEAVVPEVVNATPAQEAAENESRQYTAALTLAKEITGLDDGELLALGIWIGSNKDTLPKRIVEALSTTSVISDIYAKVFDGAPKIPEFETLVDNLKLLLLRKMEVVISFIKAQLGDKAGEAVQEYFIRVYRGVTEKGGDTFDSKKGYLIAELKTQLNQLEEKTTPLIKQLKTVVNLIAQPVVEKNEFQMSQERTRQELIAKYGYVPQDLGGLI